MAAVFPHHSPYPRHRLVGLTKDMPRAAFFLKADCAGMSEISFSIASKSRKGSQSNHFHTAPQVFQAVTYALVP